MTTPTPREWRAKFCRRTAELRDARGWTQEDMATALGIPIERYKKYETRTPLPHDLISRFALLANVTVEQMLAIDKPLRRKASSNKAAL